MIIDVERDMTWAHPFPPILPVAEVDENNPSIPLQSNIERVPPPKPAIAESKRPQPEATLEDSFVCILDIRGYLMLFYLIKTPHTNTTIKDCCCLSG